ncbi:MAG TPA: HD domain-containing protein [Chthonomonadaceae bacterium]|nr:HD domain-containing protein [Chthonomonadaceae bacterium]
MSDTTEVLAKDRVAIAPKDGKHTNGTASITGDGAALVATGEMRLVGLRDVRNNEKVRAYIEKANEQMLVIGYSEHGLRHAALVAAIARNVCLEMGFDARSAELAAIAGYLHDIGNCVHRIYHPQIGATMAFQLLDQMGMDAKEIGLIIGAIGNHEEPEGVPINTITAAVILADKSDVHFTRVQNPDPTTYDIHDRVNHAVQKSRLLVNQTQKTLTLDLSIDTKEATVMEYFEIFVVRMIMCRKAAEKLGCHFHLIINGFEL